MDEYICMTARELEAAIAFAEEVAEVKCGDLAKVFAVIERLPTVHKETTDETK